MLKKEFNDVLRLASFFIFVILLLPAFLMVTKIISNQPYLDIFFPVFLGVIGGPEELGHSLFRRAT